MFDAPKRGRGRPKSDLPEIVKRDLRLLTDRRRKLTRRDAEIRALDKEHGAAIGRLVVLVGSVTKVKPKRKTVRQSAEALLGLDGLLPAGIGAASILRGIASLDALEENLRKAKAAAAEEAQRIRRDAFDLCFANGDADMLVELTQDTRFDWNNGPDKDDGDGGGNSDLNQYRVTTGNPYADKFSNREWFRRDNGSLYS